MTLKQELIILDALISEAVTGLGDERATPEARSDLAGLFETKGRLLLQELKRQGEVGGTYTAERVFAIVGGVFEAIKEVIEDGEKIAEIGRRFARITSGRGPSSLVDESAERGRVVDVEAVATGNAG